MGTAFAGTVRAPMTSVLMIFEITRDYAVIVPLMISNLVTLFISAKLQPKPIYDELARQDGIHLPTAESRQQETQRQVHHAMREATEVFQADTTVEEALERARSSAWRAWPVSDRNGVIGVVSLGRLRQWAGEGSAGKPLREVVGAPDFPHAHIDPPLYVALDRMGASQPDLLPVVSRANERQRRGVVTLEDILAHYGIGRAAENLSKARD